MRGGERKPEKWSQTLDCTSDAKSAEPGAKDVVVQPMGAGARREGPELHQAQNKRTFFLKRLP